MTARVKATPIQLECRLVKPVELPSDFPERPNSIVIGEVIGIHIREEVLTGGTIDITKLRPVARLGYLDCAVVNESFSMPMPD